MDFVHSDTAMLKKIGKLSETWTIIRWDLWPILNFSSVRIRNQEGVTKPIR